MSTETQTPGKHHNQSHLRRPGMEGSAANVRHEVMAARGKRQRVGRHALEGAHRVHVTAEAPAAQPIDVQVAPATVATEGYHRWADLVQQPAHSHEKVDLPSVSLQAQAAEADPTIPVLPSIDRRNLHEPVGDDYVEPQLLDYSQAPVARFESTQTKHVGRHRAPEASRATIGEILHEIPMSQADGTVKPVQPKVYMDETAYHHHSADRFRKAFGPRGK